MYVCWLCIKCSTWSFLVCLLILLKRDMFTALFLWFQTCIDALVLGGLKAAIKSMHVKRWKVTFTWCVRCYDKVVAFDVRSPTTTPSPSFRGVKRVKRRTASCQALMSWVIWVRFHEKPIDSPLSQHLPLPDDLQCTGSPSDSAGMQRYTERIKVAERWLRNSKNLITFQQHKCSNTFHSILSIGN